MIDIKDIDTNRFIAIVVNSSCELPEASALYTHLLRLHKKVSLVCSDKKNKNRFSFLPWYDKIRDIIPSSADLTIYIDKNDDIYTFFEQNGIKLNQKIATALYASLLIKSDGFIGDNIDGIMFARASYLIAAGAKYKICNRFIIKRTTLAIMKLKSFMFKNIFLTKNATEATFYLCDEDLKATGATLEDAKEIIKEALYLEYLQKVTLIKSDEDNKIVKSISKDIS